MLCTLVIWSWVRIVLPAMYLSRVHIFSALYSVPFSSTRIMACGEHTGETNQNNKNPIVYNIPPLIEEFPEIPQGTPQCIRAHNMPPDSVWSHMLLAHFPSTITVHVAVYLYMHEHAHTWTWLCVHMCSAHLIH